MASAANAGKSLRKTNTASQKIVLCVSGLETVANVVSCLVMQYSSARLVWAEGLCAQLLISVRCALVVSMAGVLSLSQLPTTTCQGQWASDLKVFERSDRP